MSAFVTFHCNFSFLVTHILLFTIFATKHAAEHSKVSSFFIETIIKFISHFQKEILDSKEYCILKDSIVNLRIYASYLATPLNAHCSYVQNNSSLNWILECDRSKILNVRSVTAHARYFACIYLVSLVSIVLNSEIWDIFYFYVRFSSVFG